MQASSTASNSSPSTQQHQQQQYYQQQQHGSNIVHQQQPYRQHLNSVTSSDSLSGGNTRSRVNSDSNNCKYNNNSSSNSAKNNPPLSSDKKCANGANQNSSVNSNRNLSNNNVNSNSSSNNLSNNSNNSTNHLRQRHIIELNRQVSELNSKNIEFNRQLSAPAENQNSCNSVYNLYSNHILNNQYHSGSPNTNSLNRTKKKRSFKLNGRWVATFFSVQCFVCCSVNILAMAISIYSNTSDPLNQRIPHEGCAETGLFRQSSVKKVRRQFAFDVNPKVYVRCYYNRSSA